MAGAFDALLAGVSGGDGLESQIRQRWGKYGNWGSADQDQVSDFARLLRANGITDLSKLNFKKRAVGGDKILGGYVTEGTGDASSERWDPSLDTGATTEKRNQFDVFYDGQDVGFLGDVNRDGSLGKLSKDRRAELERAKAEGRVDPASMLSGTTDRGDNGPVVGWSSRGGGHTNFNLVEDPATGEIVVTPNWGSSKANTYNDIRGAASIGALALGAYYAPAGGAIGSAAQGGLIGYGTSVGGEMLLNPHGDVNSLIKKSLVGAGTGAIAGAGKYYADQYFSAPSGPSGAPKDYTSAIDAGVRDMAAQPVGPGDVPDFNLPPADNSIGNPLLQTGIPPGPSTPYTPTTQYGLTDKQVLYGGENYGPPMSGTQTSIYDSVLKATGSTTLATGAANVAGAGGDWGGWLKTAWDGADTFLNSGLGKALLTGAGLAMTKNAKQGAPDPMLAEGAAGIKDIAKDAKDRANSSDEEWNSIFMPRYLGLMDRADRRDQELYDFNMGRARLAARQMDQFYNQVDAYDNEGNRERLAGEAGATAEQNNSAGMAQMRRNIGRMGFNPNSGVMLSQMRQGTQQGALNKTLAMNMAREAARREGLNLRATAAGLRGADSAYAGNAASGAGLGLNAVTTGQQGFSNRNADWRGNIGLGMQGYGQLGGWGLSRSNSADQLNAANVAGWNGLIGYGLGRMWG